MTITTSEDSIKFSTEGGLGRGAITFKSKISDDEQVLVEAKRPAKPELLLSHLKVLEKTQVLSDQVALHMKTDSPLLAAYKLDKLGSLQLHIAPKNAPV